MSLLGTSATRSCVPPLGVTTTLLTDALSHRTDLAALELDEAREHVQTSALLLGASVFLVVLAGFAFTLTFTVLVWDQPHRGWWLAGLCALYLAGAGLSGYRLRQRLHTWRPFTEIRAQLQQDQQCLNRLIKSIIP